jgi:hypothetical protein
MILEERPELAGSPIGVLSGLQVIQEQRIGLQIALRFALFPRPNLSIHASKMCSFRVTDESG